MSLALSHRHISTSANANTKDQRGGRAREERRLVMCSWELGATRLDPFVLHGVSTKLLHGAYAKLLYRAPINRIMHVYDFPKTLTTLYFNSFAPLGCTKASGDMVGTYESNSDLWGCPGARVMTIFRSHVDPHIFNI